MGTMTIEAAGELADKLAWAAYMTHHLLDGIDLQLSGNERARLSQQAKDYEQSAVKVSMRMKAALEEAK